MVFFKHPHDSGDIRDLKIFSSSLPKLGSREPSANCSVIGQQTEKPKPIILLQMKIAVIFQVLMLAGVKMIIF
jgi:hypothetical protein